MKSRFGIRMTVAVISAVVLPVLATTAQDLDGDGVMPPAYDNCALEPNPLPPNSTRQIDSDWDGYGNACDPDFDQSGTVTTADYGVFTACFGQSVPGNGPPNDAMCAESDMDANGSVGGSDFSLFVKRFNAVPAQPGPSGDPCANNAPPLDTATNWPCLAYMNNPPYNRRTRDPSYIAILYPSRYVSGNGPVVAVDNTHNNYSRIDDGLFNRYLGFAQLLRADGYTVQSFGTQSAFAAGCEASLSTSTPCSYFQRLCAIDTLVMANAQMEISDEEARIIAGWVAGTSPYACGDSKPRRLFLVGDHSSSSFNFPQYIQRLATALGLVWPNATVDNSALVYTPNQPPTGWGLKQDHPIAIGSNSSETVESVKTFLGSAFTGPTGQVPILRLPDGAQAKIYASDGTVASVIDVSGYSQGTAFNHGVGRVYASGEASMFTAQMDVATGRLGMHSLRRNQNQQFLLNVMHWLDGAL